MSLKSTLKFLLAVAALLLPTQAFAATQLNDSGVGRISPGLEPYSAIAEAELVAEIQYLDSMIAQHKRQLAALKANPAPTYAAKAEIRRKEKLIEDIERTRNYFIRERQALQNGSANPEGHLATRDLSGSQASSYDRRELARPLELSNTTTSPNAGEICAGGGL